jgi:hypothetical protein
MKKGPASKQHSKKDIRLFIVVQMVSSFFFAILIQSCASYKPIQVNILNTKNVLKLTYAPNDLDR